MSHLDTAYQLGVKKAEADFQAELSKAAAPGQAVPGRPTVPTAANPQVGGGFTNVGTPPPVAPQQRRVQSATPPPPPPTRAI